MRTPGSSGKGRTGADRKIALNGALLLLSVLVCLGIGECGVRAFYPRLANYDSEMWRYFATLKQWLPYEQLPFAHIPNRSGVFYGVRIETNAQGFRDREYAREKPAGTKRVAVLGDSLVMGWGVALDDTIPKALEKKLNQNARSYEVMNLGVGNYNSTMEVEFFKRNALSFDPDIAVFVFFVNDPEPVPRLTRAGYHVKRSSYLLAALFSHYVRIRSRFDARFNWKDYYLSLYAPASPHLAANRAAIQDLAALCRARGIELVIVSYPELHQLEDYPLAVATDHIRALAEACGVKFVDLLPHFAHHEPRSLWVSEEDAHGNAKAAEIAAEAIYRAIAPDDATPL